MQQRLGRVFGPLACLFLAAPAPAQPDLLWVKQFGTSGTDDASGLAPDGAGGVFIAGSTDGSLGGLNVGKSDAYLARYNDAGDPLWVTQFGHKNDDYGSAVAPDLGGGAVVAGTSAGFDAFVARYRDDGDRAWLATIGDGYSKLHGLAVTADGAGGWFMSGYSWIHPIGDHAWLARFDAAHQLSWKIDVPFQDYGDPQAHALAVAPDGAGGAFVAGHLYNFGFLARYDGAGAQVWAKYPDTGPIEALLPDGAGGVFAAGGKTGAAFAARFNGAGDLAWLAQFNTPYADFAYALAPDGAGGVVVAGSTQGSLGGPNAGGYDVFIAQCDGAGNPGWITQFGSAGDDQAHGLAPDGAGGLFVAGSTTGNLGGPSAGGSDAFLAHLGAACYADCDGSGALDLFDFLCFVNLFHTADPAADCDANGAFDLFDFLCFVNEFNAGC